MVTCVETCVEELSSHLGSTGDARSIFEAIPESLLEREMCLGLVTKAASVWAKDLGPVEDLFTPGVPLAIAWHNFFLLDEKDKLFSILTLEAVLQSRDLRMYSENSTFTLAYWWCRLQPDSERQAFFTRLFFNRMSSDFLGSVVALCPMVIESDLLPLIMASSFCSRSRKANPAMAARLLGAESSASPPKEYPVNLCVKFYFRKRIDAVTPGTWVRFPIRVVHGYPVGLTICKNEQFSSALFTLCGQWFKTWGESSAAKIWHDEIEMRSKKRHFFSFNLDNIKINTLSFRSMINLSLHLRIISFSLEDNQGGSTAEGGEGDTVTFAATMTVTRELCGL